MLFGWTTVTIPPPSFSRRSTTIASQNAGYIVVYGNLQAASTKLYKKKDGTGGQPTGAAAYKWAAYCSLAPLITGM